MGEESIYGSYEMQVVLKQMAEDMNECWDKMENPSLENALKCVDKVVADYKKRLPYLAKDIEEMGEGFKEAVRIEYGEVEVVYRED